MATNITVAQTNLVKAFLEYTDWDGSGYAPYAVTIGTKREADPRRIVAISTMPLVTVQNYQVQAGQEMGIQQKLQFIMRLSVVHQYALAEEPTTVLRELTGKVVENILQSENEAPQQWVGLDWIEKIPFPNMLPVDNQLEMYLRGVTVESTGTGYGFTGSQTDFTVHATTV